MLQIRGSQLYALAANYPLVTFFVAISMSSAVVCAAILAAGFVVSLLLDGTIGLATDTVSSFPNSITWLTQIIWRIVWMTLLAICSFCGMFNLWVIGSCTYFMAKVFYTEEIRPFYKLFRATLEENNREKQERERIQNARVTRTILEELFCQDIAGEVAKFADLSERRPRDTSTKV